jgi:hypothetical protein
MPSVEWVEPMLAWDGRPLSGVRRPRLTSFTSDAFLPEFIAALSARGPEADPIGYLADHLIDAASEPRLYQPLHGRYYLVTASLVCRQVGLPDKAVDPSSGEKVSFVLRRQVEEANGLVEQGWDAAATPPGWRTVSPQDTRPGEERFPMHPLKVCLQSRPGLDQFRRVQQCTSERTIYHGYLPTGNREKYRAAAATSISDPQSYIATIEEQSEQDQVSNPDLAVEDFRYNEFESRVLAPWLDLLNRSDKLKPDDEPRVQTMSLYLVLDLADYLSRALPQLWEAVRNEDTAPIVGSSAQQALYTVLGDIDIIEDSSSTSLRQALANRQDDLGLVAGEGEEPNVTYDVRGVATSQLEAPDPPSDPPQTLEQAVREALADDESGYTMSEEMRGILQNMVEPAPAAGDTAPAQRYMIRLIYEYSPDCPPIVSESSQLFTLAPFFDSDAPARQIKLELPSIKMQDLRKFKRGVGMQMSPELRSLMGRVNEDMIEGGELSEGGAQWSLGMICTFSLQIIFLVAFIVMFIFLILLNIVFWWLPFLKICFPIPRRTS